MNATVPCAGVPPWPFALIPESVGLVAAAVGRLTVHGIDENQLMLELEFDLAEIGLASPTCLHKARQGRGRLGPSVPLQGKGQQGPCAPLPALPAALTAREAVPAPGGHHWAGARLLPAAGAQWDRSPAPRQVLSKAGWTDRQQEPKARLTPCITAQDLAGWRSQPPREKLLL